MTYSSEIPPSVIEVRVDEDRAKDIIRHHVEQETGLKVREIQVSQYFDVFQGFTCVMEPTLRARQPARGR